MASGGELKFGQRFANLTLQNRLCQRCKGILARGQCVALRSQEGTGCLFICYGGIGIDLFDTDLGLNELLSTYPTTIDILKMDIEGSEKILFADGAYAARFLKKVRCLAIEIHDEFECRESIYETLAINGFFYYNIKDMTIAINRNYL